MAIDIVKFETDLPEITEFYGSHATFRPAEADEENKRAFKAVAASDLPTEDFRRILPAGMPAIANGYSESQPMLVNHSTYGKDDLPIGRTTTGTYVKSKKRVDVDFYLDDADYNKRILTGIDAGTINDVSIGASGKYTCSYDKSAMGWFGCKKNGHYRGQEIMLDKNGNETTTASEMVTTAFIYAEFTARTVDELSIVYKGAVSNANITKKYHHDPAQNLLIVNAIRRVHDNNDVDAYELDRLCASYGGIEAVLKQSTAPVSVPVAKQIGGPKVSKTEYTPEVQAILDEKDRRITELETQLQTSLDRVTALETEQEGAVDAETLQAGVDRIAELEQTETELNAKVAELQSKSDAYDALVVKLRADLKLAKRQTGAPEDELDAFGTQADNMSDASAMLALLGEIEGKKQKVTAKSFSRVLNVKPEGSNGTIDQAERTRLQSAY